VREALLLQLAAVRDERRSGDADAEAAEHHRCLSARHLLGVGDLLRDRRLTSAVLLRPGDAYPAAGGEFSLPGPQAGEPPGLGEPRKLVGGEIGCQVLGEPGTELLTKAVEILAHAEACIRPAAGGRACARAPPAIA